MGIPVRELQSRISSRDFAMYMAYDRIDPHSNQRMDHGFGLVCSTIARVHGNDKVHASDFMIDYDAPVKKKKSVKDIAHTFKMFARAQNGKK